MIHDTLKNAALYSSIHPLFAQAFDYLNATDIAALPIGKIELQGPDLVLMVVEMKGKELNEALMESHNKFIDIHIPIGASETMGWITRANTNKITVAYDSENDFTLYDDEARYFIKVQPYEFAIFFPQDAHQPGIGQGIYKKIIIKVKL